MEAAKEKSLQVGFFIILSFTVFFITLFVIGGKKIFWKSYYELKIHFSQVQGLNKGSVVTLSGLSIGNVKSLAFLSDYQKIEVTLEIDSKYSNRITNSAKAEIRTQGALGDKYIFIIPGSEKDSPLNSGDILKSDDNPDFLSSLSQKGDNIKDVFSFIQEAKILLQSMNDQNRSSQIFENLKSSSHELKLFLQQSRTFLNQIDSGGQNNQKLQDSLIHLNNILEKVDNGKGTLGALVNDPSLYERMLSVLGDTSSKTHIRSLMQQSIKTYEKHKSAKDIKNIE